MVEPLVTPEEALAAFARQAPVAFAPPSMEWFVTTARRRTRQRLAVTVAVCIGVLAIGAAALAHRTSGDHDPRPIASQPAPPSPTASPPTPPPSPSPPPSNPTSASEPDIRRVDWSRATIVLPTNPDDPGCPSGRVTMKGERTWVGQRSIALSAPLVHGDLTGDGRPEVAFYSHCERPGDSGDGSGQILVVTRRDGQWVGLGYLGPVGENYQAAEIAGQRLTVTIQQRYYQNQTQRRAYRWNGTRFVQVGGPTAFPTG